MTTQRPGATASHRGSGRGLLLGLLVFFGVGFLLTMYASVRDLSIGSSYATGAIGLCAVFAWGLLVGTTRILYGSAPPASLLTISMEGVTVTYPDHRNDWSLMWADPSFRLTLRDFSGQGALLPSDLVLDTGEQSGRAWLVPSTTPPVAYLTQEAFDGLLEASTAHGLRISSEFRTGLGKSDGWLWFSRVTRIVRAPGP